MKKTIEQTIDDCIRHLIKEIAIWKHLQEHGCNDPFWPDGCNMNLTRNHILSYKHQVRKLCEDNNIPIPGEYYLPTPPEVNDNYMASLSQKKRVKRLKQQGSRLNCKKVTYDLTQQSLF